MISDSDYWLVIIDYWLVIIDYFLTTLALAARYAEGADDGGEDGDDEIDDFLESFFFHNAFILIVG